MKNCRIKFESGEERDRIRKYFKDKYFYEHDTFKYENGIIIISNKYLHTLTSCGVLANWKTYKNFSEYLINDIIHTD